MPRCWPSGSGCRTDNLSLTKHVENTWLPCLDGSSILPWSTRYNVPPSNWTAEHFFVPPSVGRGLGVGFPIVIIALKKLRDLIKFYADLVESKAALVQSKAAVV